jgi:ParB-like nuclease domain
LTAQQFAFNRRSSDHHPLRFALDDARERQHEKYKQIRASIRAVGIIEPLVVFPLGKGGYRVLDGRKRLDVVKEGNLATEIDCWLATDKPTAAGHLRFAIAALSARPNPIPAAR